MIERDRGGPWRRAVALSGFVAAAGCASPTMIVPPDVGGATESVPVVGRSPNKGLLVSEEFKIGPFDVANVSRGAKHTTRFAAFGGFESGKDGGYSFDLKKGEQALHGECVFEARASGASAGALMTGETEHEKLACACGNEEKPVAGLVLESTKLGHYGGTLRAQDSEYDVQALYERAGGVPDGNPAGYRVDGEGVQAAVDVLGPGRVWMAKTLEGRRREDVTCIFAGLLLFKPTSR